MKKLVSLCLALALVLTLAACGGGADSSGNSGEAGTSAQEADYPTAENPHYSETGACGASRVLFADRR